MAELKRKAYKIITSKETVLGLEEGKDDSYRRALGTDGGRRGGERECV